MGPNHEIRFKVSQSEKELADSVAKTFPQFKYSEFCKSLFFFGLQSFQNNLLSGKSPVFSENKLRFEKKHD